MNKYLDKLDEPRRAYFQLFLNKETYTGNHAFHFHNMLKSGTTAEKTIEKILDMTEKEIYPELYDNNLTNEQFRYVKNIYDAEYKMTRMGLTNFNYEDVGPQAFHWEIESEVEFPGIIYYQNKSYPSNYPNTITILFDYEDMLRIFSANDPINEVTKVSYPATLTQIIKDKYKLEIFLWKRGNIIE